jgi:predicted amidophosphoribosyltransferase
MDVVSFATYLTRGSYSNEDHNALKFVKAVKGKTFLGYADVPVSGQTKRLNPSNSEEAVEWFGELAAAEISKLKLPGPVILVPVPNSSCTEKNGKEPRTALLARAIAGKLKNAAVWDGLRWTKEMTPTHKGGTRDPQKLYDNLAVANPLPKGTLVLVDDVYTKGGHMQAAVARLSEKKAQCSLAVCAGRTVLEAEKKPFAVLKVELEKFTPTMK